MRDLPAHFTMSTYLINRLPFLVLLLLFMAGPSLNAQTVRAIAVNTDTVIIDSNSLVPGTFSINGIDTSAYNIDEAQGVLIWKNKPQTDSVTMEYSALPLNLSKRYFHKDISDYKRTKTGAKNPFKYQTEVTGENPGFSQLDKQGSVSRGINFGNNQNLGVNSNLNLQLSGKLTEEITLMAAISDENIPIQPDGNTQQLQDFDQVYIKLSSKRTELTAGDFQTQSKESFFLKYNKRLRGGALQTGFDMAQGKAGNQVGVGAAISRGKFSRNIIQGAEGNQGPYRLTGAENESFIIILSGTERVFIDGKELTRGQEYDYIIDYNRAEITFTAKQPITKDKRIIVEFQYSGQAYSRSLLTFKNTFQTQKLRLNLNIYAEQDAKNQPLQQDLNDAERNILINAGDDVNAAISPGYELNGFEDDRVRYKLLTDTNPTGEIDSIFVYSTNPDSALYEVRFTDVGDGNGNYLPLQSSANGTVYRYIAPVAGIPQGSFEPVVVLVTPKLRQMMSLGGSYKTGKHSSLSFEGALSRNDLNTFSNKDDQDNYGTAVFVQYDAKTFLKKDTSNWALTTIFRHEQVDRNFREIEFFRSAEFDRDWNLRNITLNENTYLPGASLGVYKSNIGSAAYEFQTYLAGEEYEGLKHGAVIDMEKNGFSLDYSGSLTSTKGSLFSSEFNRHKTLFSKSFEKVKIGYRDDLEHNEQRNPQSDSLLPTGYKFWEWEAFVSSVDSATNTYKLSYTERSDFGSLNNQFTQSTFGKSYGAEFGLNKNPNARVKAKSTYRILEVKNNELYADDPEENLISRLEYTFRLFKGGITTSGFYEIGSGLEERRDFVYVEVSPGQGVYTWTDYNENGIKEQNEFDIALFPDQANYVRVSVQTNDFIKTYTNQYNQMLFLRPSLFLKKETKLNNFINKFSNQVAYRIERKTNREEELNRFNPFYNPPNDSTIISANSSFRNTLYFNRVNRRYGGEYTYTSTALKTIQTEGLDGNNRFRHEVDLRFNFNKELQLNLIAGIGEKGSTSSFFEERNYTLTQEEYGPKLTYQPGPQFNLIGSYTGKTQVNIAAEGGETSEEHNAGLEVRWNQPGKGSLTGKLNYVVIAFEGDVLSPIAYDMLQGLLPGQNGTWEVSYRRTLGKNLQLNLSYNGRKSENTPTIHTGGVQVRAFF